MNFQNLHSYSKKFSDYLSEIYTSWVTVEEANKSNHLVSYLYLTFLIESGGKLSSKLYDGRDDFVDFHIVNFPFFPATNHLYLFMLYIYTACLRKTNKDLINHKTIGFCLIIKFSFVVDTKHSDL